MRTVDSTPDQRKKLVHALSRTALFGSLSPEQLESMSAEAGFRIYDSGELLVGQGESSQDFFVILKGHARVTVQSQDGEHDSELATLGPSDAVGEMGLLLDQPRSASVHAQESLLVAQIGRDLFGRLFRDIPSFGQAISRALAGRLSATLRKIPLPAASEESLPSLEVLKLLPIPFMQRHRILPLRTEGTTLIVGCVEDVPATLMERIKPLTPGMELRSKAISRDYFEEALRSLSAGGQAASGGPETPEVRAPLRSLMEIFHVPKHLSLSR